MSVQLGGQTFKCVFVRVTRLGNAAHYGTISSCVQLTQTQVACHGFNKFWLLCQFFPNFVLILCSPNWKICNDLNKIFANPHFVSVTTI